MKVIVHIGLHKTGTKYFQNYIFPKLQVLYNPKHITQYVMDFLRADKYDKPRVFEIFLKEKKRLKRQYPNEILLISKESLAGNLFTAYNDWDESMELLYELFPEAVIIIFFRYQTDWLLSCYKESIYEHHYQKIDNFLDFLNTKKDFHENGFVKMYPYNLNYVSFIKTLYKYYNNIFIFFHEDLKKNRKNVINNVLDVIGVKRGTFPNSTPNRGYSSFGVKLSLLRYKIFKGFVHRPITFFGSGSVPAGNESLSCLDKEKYWNDNYYFRDNEEIRSINYPDLSMPEMVRMEFSWRHFVKHRLDKLFYFNSDLLYKHRPSMDRKFKKMNQKMCEYNKVPEMYYK